MSTSILCQWNENNDKDMNDFMMIYDNDSSINKSRKTQKFASILLAKKIDHSKNKLNETFSKL